MTQSDESLLARVPAEARLANGIPSESDLELGERAAAVVRRVLSDELHPDGLRVSPLGPGWSRDLDAHVHSWPDAAALRAAGWLPLDGLQAQLGRRDRGQWAVVDNGKVLARADLQDAPPPDPVASVLDRCARRGSVRVREALELRAMVRAGTPLPADHRVVRAAAAIEAWLGGDILDAYREGPEMPGPVALGRPSRRRLGGLLRPFRPRLTLALSGVDGSGKSTLARHLREDLRRAGVRVGSVWARPGMNLGLLSWLSYAAKRVLGQNPEPGVRAVARGEGTKLRSRRGAVGWAWSMLVTLAFITDVWRQHLSTRGVVIYDRHTSDAVVTLDVLYGGDLRVQRTLVRRMLPSAALTAFLAVDGETAVARKPGDTIGPRAVAAQLDRYDRELTRVGSLLRLNGCTPPSKNALLVLTRLLERLPSSPSQ